jgi:hypothetical protein
MSERLRLGRLRQKLWCSVLLTLGPGVPTVLAQQATPTVGQWDRFETAVTKSADYADPYRDVDLLVTYTRPDGTTVDFWGFYDGGETWRIRFMPDQLGTWRYAARFSDGTPGVSGSFQVVSTDVPGMISVDGTNPLWFGFKGGRHVLIRSFHVGDRFFAENWDDPADPSDGNKRTIFLDWARRQGYNLLSIGSLYLNREAEGRGKGWDTPDLWPLNAAEYRKLERILDDLARRRIMVFPFGGFFGRDSDFPRDPAEQERYLRYALARVGPYWNLMFNVGGPEPLLEHNPYLTKEEVDRLGRTIKRLDVFGHPLTVHNPGGGDEFRDRAWLDYGTLQGPKTGDLKELSAGLLESHHPRKPLYAQETLWSGNMYHMQSLGGRDYTDDELRKNAYVINLSATALNFADNSGNSSSGFTGTLELSDAAQPRHDIVKRVWDFFETVPFYRKAPCQELVSAGYCLGEEGRQYLVYLPEGGSVDVRLPAGRYAVEWIDARDPSRRRHDPPIRAGRRLTAPAEGDDWLVYLTRQD